MSFTGCRDDYGPKSVQLRRGANLPDNLVLENLGARFECVCVHVHMRVYVYADVPLRLLAILREAEAPRS